MDGCKPCDKNYYWVPAVNEAHNYENPKCVACPAGTRLSDASITECVDCPAGEWSYYSKNSGECYSACTDSPDDIFIRGKAKGQLLFDYCKKPSEFKKDGGCPANTYERTQ